MKKWQYFLIFLVLVLFYSGFGTALTFHFEECKAFPNYNQLTRSLAEGRLDVERGDTADLFIKDGKAYLYFGPVPALIRLPVYLLTGRGLPTGFMIAVFLSGTTVWFLLILQSLINEADKTRYRWFFFIFFSVMTVNGYSLTMVSVPGIHNEAITAAMFFFTRAIFIYITIRNQNLQASRGRYVLLGLFLAAAFGSRFFYILNGALLGLFLVIECWREKRIEIRKTALRKTVLVGMTGTVMFIVLLGYNHIRFDSAFNFGNKEVASYRKYFSEQGFFRYDHIPHNLWNMFFRLPEMEPQYPFIRLPGYIVEVKPVFLAHDRLVNTNELAASIFLLIPITLLVFVPRRFLADKTGNSGIGSYRMFAAFFLVQVFILAPTVAMTVRYYYDFLPIMLIMAFLGAVALKEKGIISDVHAALLGAVSIAISFTVLLNAIDFYQYFIGWKSPLLSLLY